MLIIKYSYSVPLAILVLVIDCPSVSVTEIIRTEGGVGRNK